MNSILIFGFESMVQSFIKIDIKIENCDRGRGDRHTDTQARVNLLSAPCYAIAKEQINIKI